MWNENRVESISFVVCESLPNRTRTVTTDSFSMCTTCGYVYIYIANRRQKEQCCMDFTGVHVLHRFGIQCYPEKLDNIKGELSFEKNYSNETF